MYVFHALLRLQKIIEDMFRSVCYLDDEGKKTRMFLSCILFIPVPSEIF